MRSLRQAAHPRDRIAFAVDAPGWAEAARVVAIVAPHVGVLKIGLELFVREGPAVVRSASDLGLAVFLDLKLHDIPETVERAVAAAVDCGAAYLTIHAQGGSAMMERAARRAEGSATTVLAVTVLTSLDDGDLEAQGILGGAPAHVVRLARLAWSAGVRGFVSSAAEAGSLRAAHPDALLVTPGVRLPTDDAADQKRVTTPEAAVRAGADLLVVGRPIRDASDPVAACRAIAESIARADTPERVGA